MSYKGSSPDTNARTDACRRIGGLALTDLERLHEQSFGWALTCCGWDRPRAEDVLQATYVKVLSGRARFKGKSSYRTWLFAVIRRTALEHGRRARVREAALRRWSQEVGRNEPSPTEPDGSHAALEREERSARLIAALAALPERQREVLHLVFYQGLSIAEASEVMGVSLGTARTHYERGKTALRKLLTEENVR